MLHQLHAIRFSSKCSDFGSFRWISAGATSRRKQNLNSVCREGCGGTTQKETPEPDAACRVTASVFWHNKLTSNWNTLQTSLVFLIQILLWFFPGSRLNFRSHQHVGTLIGVHEGRWRMETDKTQRKRKTVNKYTRVRVQKYLVKRIIEYWVIYVIGK